MNDPKEKHNITLALIYSTLYFEMKKKNIRPSICRWKKKKHPFSVLLLYKLLTLVQADFKSSLLWKPRDLENEVKNKSKHSAFKISSLVNEI